MAATLQPAAANAQPDAPGLASQLDAILHAAAIASIPDRAFLRIAGPDATRWLNGMVTNNIQSLQPGEGCYNFILNAQGRILGDCTIYREPATEPAAYLLATDASQLGTIQQHLDKFIIMDDVELQPTPGNQHGLLLLGPGASSILGTYFRKLHGGDYAKLPPFQLAFDTETANQITTPTPGPIPQFEVRSPNVDPLMQHALAAGATPVSAEALEQLRILEGTPRYGTDIRNTEKAHDLPQETGQTRALHFTKGCYLGQEIVERIRSRGQVHRTFSGFELTGALPAPGAELTAAPYPRPVGELTSVAAIQLPASATAPAEVVQLALGYIRRELVADAQARGLTLEYPGGIATPIALPYPIS